VVVQAAGFQNNQTEISVGATGIVRVGIVMAIAAQRESVTVAGNAAAQVSTAVADNRSSNCLDREALDRGSIVFVFALFCV
jgi:hypothetical protein